VTRPQSSEPARLPLQSLPTVARWTVLVAASILVAAVLQCARLPAAFMLGPLAAAVLAQTAGGAVKIPRVLIAAAQAIIGCLIASSITPEIISDFARQWPVFLGVVVLSVAVSAAIGWAMSRLNIMSGSTAVWGMLPGAATAMMVMAEAYGADFRLVAFMQYLRIVLVAASASVVAVLFVHGGGSRFAGGYFPGVNVSDLAATAAVALIGGWLGLVSRVPAGVLLGPMALGAVLNVLGWVRIELPPTLLIASYALIGWTTGLRFSREVLGAAARALPQSIGAIALLMGSCGLLAWMLAEFLHVDALTAYLATSPGGLDAAALIAASTKVDLPFVMALQTARAILLLIVGPPVARWVAGTIDRTRPNEEAVRPPDLGDLD
jgi:uncharacterized protein